MVGVNNLHIIIEDLVECMWVQLSRQQTVGPLNMHLIFIRNSGYDFVVLPFCMNPECIILVVQAGRHGMLQGMNYNYHRSRYYTWCTTMAQLDQIGQVILSAIIQE